MEKYKFDESNGLWYELQGDYYLLCLKLPEEDQVHIGIWGQQHLRHKSIKTTIDTYCDVFEANEQKKCKYYEYIFTGKQLSLYA